jgi:hypothetical protein
MLIKICQTCKKPFKALSASLYIKFCSIECVDEAYKNRQLDQETTERALKLIKKSLREREIDIETSTLRELFFLEILKINHLVSETEYKDSKKEILCP